MYPHATRECAKDLYQQAGIQNPRKEIDVAEVYVPFSWFEPMWMENPIAEHERGLAADRRAAPRRDEGGDIPGQLSAERCHPTRSAHPA